MLVPFLIAAAMAWTAALLGYFLYRFGEGRIERRGMRLTGAAAIAAASFSAMSGLYLKIAPPQRDVASPIARAQLENTIREVDTCSEHHPDLARCRPLVDDLARYCTAFAGLQQPAR
jgi:hypothetical protein